MKISINKYFPATAIIIIYFAGIFGLSTSAEAANWFKLRGTEPGGAVRTLQVWGFLQPTYASDSSNSILGAVGGAAPLNGTESVPGTLPPDRLDSQGFFMRRARIGIRGTMLPINNDIDYFVLTEFGENGITRNGGAGQLLDASVTFNQLSRGVDDDGLQNLGGRIRIGQFLFSQASESLSHSTPGRRIHVFMPEATLAFGLTRLASDNMPDNFPKSTVVNGGRDIGIELFDWAEFPSESGGPLEFTYSLAIGNGGTIGEQNRDGNFRHYAWLSFARLFDHTRGPRRHDIMMYAFYQQGNIEFNNDVNNDGIGDDRLGASSGGACTPVDGCNDSAGNNRTTATFAAQLAADRLNNRGNARDEMQKYWGIGVEYFDKPFANAGQIRFEAEYQQQKGLIFDGTQSPSSVWNQGLGIRYIPDGKSDGFYIGGGYDIQKHLGIKQRTTINLRYDQLNRATGDTVREVTFKTWSLTGEYFFAKMARAALTYQHRRYDADNRTDVGSYLTNGNAALKQIDDRIALQVTFIFKNVLLR